MRTPMLWSFGFLMTFLLGGMSGVLIASPPLDFHLTDSSPSSSPLQRPSTCLAMFAGFYFWWPKFTGRLLDERLGKITF
ncbi:hypothetical protein [Streptomyces sp. DHE17-7]|uniref:hypothetical protein n=1 Tax=Streptomyces sp. DHE17-7 TaxID=2759949 RepID=UPI0022EB2C1C|nr:hypothetical protein [Streptomyces sp. DHE17-7]